ncbi:NAD-dependent epimerase/dehydratase family protein [Rhizobium sp.]|jgi:nucleoside-diphosphate-sugar epimerase|uniref:NAD-dependent epimerase/dehydratase family protein n=1 Tax=Rhizobium sp. TaxID=391 RepID=UPI000E8B17C3|nr:reductase [Rhizobium sp.]
MAKRSAIIIGGTGQIGQAVAQNLLQSGWDVSLTHRGNSKLPETLAQQGAKSIIHDREKSSLGEAIGSGADVVIDTIAYDAKHGQQLLDVQNDVGAFIVISSSSVYCDEKGRSLDEALLNGFPDLPEAMTESQSTLPPGDDNYSTKKVALELCLLEKSTSPVTILRPCAIHGVNSVHPREWWFIKRMLDGRSEIPLAYKGQSRFHTTAVANIAGLIDVIVSKASPPILNIGDERCLTVAEIGQTLADYLGFSVRLVDGDNIFPAKIGGTPWSVPTPFMIDSSAARSLGFVPQSYQTTIGPVCDWLMDVAKRNLPAKLFPVFDTYKDNPFDYGAEDMFLLSDRTDKRAMASPE